MGCIVTKFLRIFKNVMSPLLHEVVTGVAFSFWFLFYF